MFARWQEFIYSVSVCHLLCISERSSCRKTYEAFSLASFPWKPSSLNLKLQQCQTFSSDQDSKAIPKYMDGFISLPNHLPIHGNLRLRPFLWMALMGRLSTLSKQSYQLTTLLDPHIVAYTGVDKQNIFLLSFLLSKYKYHDVSILDSMIYHDISFS